MIIKLNDGTYAPVTKIDTCFVGFWEPYNARGFSDTSLFYFQIKESNPNCPEDVCKENVEMLLQEIEEYSDNDDANNYCDI